MICLDFDWQIDEFMVYCRSIQLMSAAGQISNSLTNCRAQGFAAERPEALPLRIDFLISLWYTFSERFTK